MTSQIKLPETPTVVVRDNVVIIIFDDNSELIWGEEKTAIDAQQIASELEIELRAVNYVRWHVRTFIQEMKKQLASLNIDEGLLDTILIDGHAFARSDINKATFDTILAGAEQGLRKQVLTKLGSHDFIV